MTKQEINKLKQDLRRANKLLSDANGIFNAWFQCCSDDEIRDSFSDWRRCNNKIKKHLNKSNQ